MTQKPSVGRIVHKGLEPTAAIITKVNGDETVDLHLFCIDGTTEHQTGIPYSETPSNTAWSWPPRV